MRCTEWVGGSDSDPHTCSLVSAVHRGWDSLGVGIRDSGLCLCVMLFDELKNSVQLYCILAADGARAAAVGADAHTHTQSDHQ